MPSRSATEDLFPRGHARGQPVSRIKADEKKASENENKRARERDSEHLRRGRLTQGATVLAVVTRCDERAVYFELPSGVRAGADPHETLDDDVTRVGDAVAAAAGQIDTFAPERDDATPLYRVLRPGQVVRAAVIAQPSNAGSNYLQLSLKPELVNAGLSPATLLMKDTHAYAAIKSVEDHGYVVHFGSVPTRGFLPFEDAPAPVASTGAAKHGKTGNGQAKIKENDSDESDSDSDDSSSSGGSESSEDEDVLLPGTPIEVVVTQSTKVVEEPEESLKKKKRKRARALVSTVRVSAKPELVQKAESLMFEGLTFHGLRAGMRIGAKVLSVTRSRVLLTGFGLFTIIVDAVHVPHDSEGSPSVKPGTSVTVRLLSVDATQKLITASLLPDVVNGFRVREISAHCKVGTVLKDLTIDHIESSFGLYFKQNSDKIMENADGEASQAGQGKLNAPIFAHISRVTEKRIETLEKHFHKGKTIEQGARIVSISKFDGTVNVDLRPSIIRRAALDLSEVRPGEIYDCKVMAHLSSGALSVAVDGDIHIRGIVPKLHIADTSISSKMLARHPNLRSGGTVKCVALAVNEPRGMVYLSARRSLVGATDPLLLSFEQADVALKEYNAAEGDISAKSNKVPIFVGTVSRVMEKNMLVSFCNNAKGLMSFSELGLDDKSTMKTKKRKRAEKGVPRTQEDVSALYPLGQTVRVCVLSVNLVKQRLFLSMDLTGARIALERGVPVGSTIDMECEVQPRKKKAICPSIDVKVGRSTIGRLHATNYERLTTEETESVPLGPLSAELKKRFTLPKEGSSVSALKIVSNLKRRGKSSKTMATVELATGRARDSPYTTGTIPKVGSRVVAFLLPKKDTSKESEDKRNIMFQITPYVRASCPRIDSILGGENPSFISDRRPSTLPTQCLVQAADKKIEYGKEKLVVKVIASPNGLNPEKLFIGTIQKVEAGSGLVVRLPWLARPEGQKKTAIGRVSLSDVHSDFDVVAKKMSAFKPGEFVHVRIVKSADKEKTDTSKSTITLSMRESDSESDAKDTLITTQDLKKLKAGQKVRGFVNSVTKFGAFVEIGRGIRVLVRLADLSDEYVREPAKQFPRGTLVTGKIVVVKSAKGDTPSIAMSLRTKERPAKTPKEDNVKEGQVVQGKVIRVERYGAVVKLSNGQTALLHKSEADQDRKVEDTWAEWSVEQPLTAVVITAKGKNRKLSMKRCYFEAAGIESEKIEAIFEANVRNQDSEPESKKRKLLDNDAENESLDIIMKSVVDGKEDSEEENEEGDTMEIDGANEDVDEESASDSSDVEEVDAESSVLNIPHTFAIEEEEEAEQATTLEENKAKSAVQNDKENEAGTAEESTLRKKKTSKEKREKKRAKEAAEREIQAKEETLASNPDSPESAEDFERMILGEPNSSAIWIRYMAFRLSLLQIDKARAIAERALDTIDMTKELERVNIWMSYINLEANFGGSSGGSSNPLMKAAAVFRVFDRAVKRVTDVLDLYLQVFASLRESELEIAEEVMKRAMRNFKSSKEIWIAAGSAKFEKGDSSGARKLLERALLSLSKRDHVSVIMKFSQLEYRYGTVERARTVFESLIGNYPKRLDVWNVFLDMETGQCRLAAEGTVERSDATEATRMIFERCAGLDLSIKKMKSVFKKWLSFEKDFGDKSSHKAVLVKAKQYVENKASVTDTPQEE